MTGGKYAIHPGFHCLRRDTGSPHGMNKRNCAALANILSKIGNEFDQAAIFGERKAVSVRHVEP